MLLAGAAGARIVAPDLRGSAHVLRGRRMMVMAVIAVGAVDVAGCAMVLIVTVVVIAIGTMNVRCGGFERVGHEAA
jgi:hypothetical protein